MLCVSRRGDRVQLFNGSDAVAEGEITQTSRQVVSVCLLKRQQLTEKVGSTVTVATALPKGERQRWMIEKLTELGVDFLLPLRTERSVVDLKTAKADKLQNAVIAACKQCGRNRLMRILPLQAIGDLPDSFYSENCYLGDPSGIRLSESHVASGSSAIIVGPEGGLTDVERSNCIHRGAKLASLGPHILRIETAAVAGAVMLCSRQ